MSDEQVTTAPETAPVTPPQTTTPEAPAEAPAPRRFEAEEATRRWRDRQAEQAQRAQRQQESERDRQYREAVAERDGYRKMFADLQGEAEAKPRPNINEDPEGWYASHLDALEAKITQRMAPFEKFIGEFERREQQTLQERQEQTHMQQQWAAIQDVAAQAQEIYVATPQGKGFQDRLAHGMKRIEDYALRSGIASNQQEAVTYRVRTILGVMLEGRELGRNPAAHVDFYLTDHYGLPPAAAAQPEQQPQRRTAGLTTSLSATPGTSPTPIEGGVTVASQMEALKRARKAVGNSVSTTQLLREIQRGK